MFQKNDILVKRLSDFVRFYKVTRIYKDGKTVAVREMKKERINGKYMPSFFADLGNEIYKCNVFVHNGKDTIVLDYVNLYPWNGKPVSTDKKGNDMATLDYIHGEIFYDNTPINKLTSTQEGYLKDYLDNLPSEEDIGEAEDNAHFREKIEDELDDLGTYVRDTLENLLVDMKDNLGIKDSKELKKLINDSIEDICDRINDII